MVTQLNHTHSLLASIIEFSTQLTDLSGGSFHIYIYERESEIT